MQRVAVVLLMSLILAGLLAQCGWAEGEPPTLESLAAGAAELKTAADTVWVVLAAVLVFFMQAGFAYVVAVFGWAAVTGLLIFGTLRATFGLRATPQEEIDGLDMHEHGAAAYTEIFVQSFPGLPTDMRIPVSALQEAEPVPFAEGTGESIQAPASPMALLTAIIRPQELERVRVALASAGINSLTATEVRGSGQQGGYKERFRGVEYTVSLMPKVRLDIVVPQDKAQTVADTIMSVARTGAVGDGKVFVTPVEDAMRIRTGERGLAAV